MYGVSLPISTSFYCEISPLYFRAKGIIMINFSIAIGQIIAIFLTYFILEDINNGKNNKIYIYI